MKIKHGWELTVPHHVETRRDTHPDVAAARARRQAYRDNAASRADREALRLRKCRERVEHGQVLDEAPEHGR